MEPADGAEHSRVSQRGMCPNGLDWTDIAITYHRPEVGDGKSGQNSALGKVWRAGANENTTITFSDDVSVEGNACGGHVWAAHDSRQRSVDDYFLEEFDLGAASATTRKRTHCA